MRRLRALQIPTPLALAVAGMLAASAVQAQTARASTAVLPTAPCGRVEVAPVVQVSVGKSTVLKPATPIRRVLLGNPENSRAAAPKESDKADKGKDAAPAHSQPSERRPGVAELDVLLLGPSEVYVLGKGVGSTNVVLLDKDGGCTAFDVVVGLDTAALQTVIAQLLPQERDIRVAAAYDSIVLSGSVTEAGSVARVLDLANAFVRTGTGASVAGANPRVVNMLSAAAPQQVMLEVKVAEVSKSLLDQFGINFARAFVSGDGSMVRFLSGIFGGDVASIGQISGTGPNNVPLSSAGTVIGGSISGSAGNGSFTVGNVTRSIDPNGIVTYTTTYGTAPAKGVTNGALQMQRNDGMVKVLAEPNVMAISGQEGRFNAGGKIFIPVAQANQGSATTVTLEEKEFGVSVRFRPTVLDGGRINLELVTEVSELNGSGVTIAGLGGTAVLPSFTSRKASTTVQLVDGQSFAVGGLIKNNTTSSIKAFPVLGELPVVGALFRSTEFQSDKSELVFVVTPRLVKPLPTDYRLPTDNYREPSRNDLILQGRLEGRAEAPRTPSAQAPQGPAQTAAQAPAQVAAQPADGFQVK